MNKKGKSAPARVIAILLIIIVLLIAILLYTFIIKPKFNAYVVNKQVAAKDAVLNTELLQLQQRGYIQISDQEGKFIYLVQISPEQLQQLLANQQTIEQKTQNSQ